MNSVFSIPLDMIQPGVWADVVDVYGDSTWVCRMSDMGIRMGSRIRVVQPGRPCIVEIGSTRLSVRGNDAGQVFVKPIELLQ
jgi:Fe2+ transport system protein FeoA